MRIMAAFRYALAGIVYCVRKERHMRFHIGAALSAALLAWLCRLDGLETAVLLLTIAGVITAEMFNTALEVLVNKVSPEFHPLAKIVKDAAAGAVLIQAIAAVGVGCILFGDKLLKWVVK